MTWEWEVEDRRPNRRKMASYCEVAVAVAVAVGVTMVVGVAMVFGVGMVVGVAMTVGVTMAVGVTQVDESRANEVPTPGRPKHLVIWHLR